MFEKEAEEAGNEKIKGNYQFARYARKSYKDGFKDGAEFGYNKFMEELKKTGLALQSDMDKTIEQNIALKKENAEMKEQLTKAKELLTKWAELFKPKGGNIPPTPIQVETEQFISEVEK